MRFTIASFLLALAASSLFLVGLNGPFILDDDSNILLNYNLYIESYDLDSLFTAALSFFPGNGSRPLPMLSFALDYLRTGSMDPFTFKTTNLLIHALTCLALALFSRRLLQLAGWSATSAARGALVLTAFWAIHPLQVSSVLYVVQRMQTLATLFIVLALWAYLAMRQDQLNGGRGRKQGLLMVACALLALACKEDAVLLPLYTLLLELYILRFAAGQPVVSQGLRQSYALFSIAALAFYALWAVPHYWSWGPYPLRDFSSYERLLTQGRVLVLYLSQIIWPLPDRLQFIYDTYPVSRSLWQPWDTLPSLLLLAALLFSAIYWRKKRPLMSFGIAWFFAGHFISSNVVNLELVFEHRNQLPLMGIVLALIDLARTALLNRPRLIAASGLVIGTLLSISTLSLAYTWGDGERLNQKLVTQDPLSVRAWNQYATFYFREYGKTQDPKYLEKAVTVTEQARQHIQSASFTGNLLIYKYMLNKVNDSDWQDYFKDLQGDSSITVKRTSLALLVKKIGRSDLTYDNYAIHALTLFIKQTNISSAEYLYLGELIYQSKQPEQARLFFEKAAATAPANDPDIIQLRQLLSSQGHADWLPLPQAAP